jgi:Holliday junction resolvasome RuvABC endonuclease subunit
MKIADKNAKVIDTPPAAILGLDVSSTTVGWAWIVEGLVESYGTYHLRGEIGKRVADAAAMLPLLLSKRTPQLVIMEDVATRFMGSAIPQCNVQGQVLRTFWECHIPVRRITPASVKRLFTGDGKADKIPVLRKAALYVVRDDRYHELLYKKMKGSMCAVYPDGTILLDEHSADAIAIGLSPWYEYDQENVARP